jgi:hypothetical protein
MIVLETRWQVSSFLYSRVESINIKVSLKLSTLIWLTEQKRDCQKFRTIIITNATHK